MLLALKTNSDDSYGFTTRNKEVNALKGNKINAFLMLKFCKKGDPTKATVAYNSRNP